MKKGIYYWNASSVEVNISFMDQFGNWGSIPLSPGKSKELTDPNISNAGFSFSGFTGITVSPIPNNSPYLGIFFVYDSPPSASQIKEAEKELAKK